MLSSFLVEELTSDQLRPETELVEIVDGGTALDEVQLSVLDNPYRLDLRRFTPNDEVLTLEKFFELAARVIDFSQEQSGISEQNKVKLYSDYPAEEFQRLGDAGIYYKVKRRAPASTNPSGEGRPSRHFRHSYKTRIPEDPQRVQIVEVREIDHTIEFGCWSKSSRLANKLVLWLERLFINSTWIFEISGANRFIWEERGIDMYMMTNGQRLYFRPLTFKVRLSEFRIKAEPVIQQMVYQIEHSSGTN